MSKRIDRREFVKRAAAASAALGFTGALPAWAGSKKPDLVQITGPGVPAGLSQALKKLLAPLGGMPAFVKKGQTVLLKPNMGFATLPEVRATTSPQLVAAVAREVLACGARVIILDNPVRHPEACLRKNGIKAAVADLGVTVATPTSERHYHEVAVPKGQMLKKVAVLAEALKADLHIALPLAKSHGSAGFSGAVKGMMGLIYDRGSFHSRYDLSQAIADLATVLKADLTILDGLQVMTEGGPAGPGKLVTCNALIASTDMVAADAAGVKLAPLYGRELDPKRIKHLALAEKLGVGRLNPPTEKKVLLSL